MLVEIEVNNNFWKVEKYVNYYFLSVSVELNYN